MSNPHDDWPKSRSRLPDRSLERESKPTASSTEATPPKNHLRPARVSDQVVPASDSKPGPLKVHLFGDPSAEPHESDPSTPPLTWSWTWQKIVAWMLGLWVFTLAAGAGLVVYVVDHYSADLPDVKQLQHSYAPPQLTRVYARDGTVLANIFSERRTVVPFSRVPDHVKSAFLAAEDARFFEHKGLNYLGLLRAMAVNLRSGEVRQGGSTITQQVVKNVLLDQERSYRRKVRETILAYRLEKTLSKEQILGMYLNHIYLGHGRYGVEEAGRYYFGKHVEELNVAEAALLAGIVAAPEHFSPRKDEKKALARRAYVLGQMLSKGFMTQVVYTKALSMPVRLVPVAESESDIAPEMVLHAQRKLKELAGEQAQRGGYSVYTTIDPALQVAARAALRKGLDDYLVRQKLKPPFTLQKRKLWGKVFEGRPRKYGIYAGTVTAVSDQLGTITVQVGQTSGVVHLHEEARYNPSHIVPSEFVGLGAVLRVQFVDDPSTATFDHPARLRLELGPQAALVAVDPTSRQVLAAVGSYEALPGGLDRSVQTKRQPGSTFKPLVYSYALATHKVTAATRFDFPKTEEIVVDGVKMEQTNIEHLSLRRGVATSDNRVALDVFQRVGGEAAVDWARQFGISSKLGPTESLMLGAYEVSVAEMAAAYAVFASGGIAAPLRFITKVESGSGIVEGDARAASHKVMEPAVAYLMTDILKSVITSGTASYARLLDRPVAGKTGTTNGAKDAWFVGYSTDLVVAVWVGFDDALPLGWGESGAQTALPIWTSFMKTAQANQPATEFPRPSDVVDVNLDPDSLLLARYGQQDVLNEVFLRGTEPSETAPEVPVEPPEVPSSEANNARDGDLLEHEPSSTPQLPRIENQDPTNQEPSSAADTGTNTELSPYAP